MSNDPAELARHESNLRRQEMQWQSGCDYILHSDRAAVDTGLTALKTAILINAGATVALLALVGNLWNNGNGHTLVSHVLSASVPFVWGLVFGGVSLTVAYFYQSAVTLGAQHTLAGISERNGAPPPSLVGVRRFTRSSAIVMVLLAFASLGCFIWGALAVIHVFEKFVQ